jgi:deoxyribonuclease V
MQDDFRIVTRVAGVDVGFEDGKTTSRAAAVLLDFPTLEPLQSGVARRPVTFPYIPGLLAFREAPVVMDALGLLSKDPEILVVDGHGFAHPRRFGIACMLGVLLDQPTIGCAKSILVGEAEEPANEKGAWTPLVDKGEVIGATLRTRPDVRPIYVSVGHRISLESAIELILKFTSGFRLPEPIRFAHRVASGLPIEPGM